MPTPTGYTSIYTAAQIDEAVGNVPNKVSKSQLYDAVEGQYVEITSGQDLDTFTTPNVYLSYSSAITNSLSHIPDGATGYGFRLDVKYLRYDKTLLMQELYLATNPIRKYYRRFLTNAWGDWFEDRGYGSDPSPYRIIYTAGTVKYYKISTITANRAYPLHIGGCNNNIANHFDLDVLMSRDSCNVYATHLNGTGYGAASDTTFTLYFDSSTNTLYAKTGTYTSAVIMGYGNPSTIFGSFEEVSSIPSTATYLEASPIPISSFENDANYVASSNVATIYSGSSAPSSSTGSDGDIYIQTS